MAAPSASATLAMLVIRAPSSPASHDVYDRTADLCFRISQSDEHREAGANKKENMPRHVMSTAITGLLSLTSRPSEGK